MVARAPTKEERRLHALRETVKKVDRAMERLQELQYAITGGKVISGVTLSPRSTKGYIRTSIRCKQESLRIRNSTSRRCSPNKIAPCSSGEWRRMSLQAMLIGETVGEILQVSKFAKEAVDAVSAVLPLTGNGADGPQTPVAFGPKHNLDKEEMKVKRAREKHKMNNVSPLSGRLSSPAAAAAARRRARSRIIIFKLPGEKTPASARRERAGEQQHSVQRISPRLPSSGGKAVLFPNRAFQSSPSPRTRKSVPKSRSPPHKFAIKSSTTLASKFTVKIRSPPVSVGSHSPSARAQQKKQPPPLTKPKISPMPSKFRLSLSPSRFAKRLASPMKMTSSPLVQGKKKQQPSRSQMTSSVMSKAAMITRSLSPSNFVKRLASPLKSRNRHHAKGGGGGTLIPAIGGGRLNLLYEVEGRGGSTAPNHHHHPSLGTHPHHVCCKDIRLMPLFPPVYSKKCHQLCGFFSP